MNVDRVWWAEVTPNDYYRLSRENSVLSIHGLRNVMEFFDVPIPDSIDKMEDVEIQAGVIGDPWLLAPMRFHFDPRAKQFQVSMAVQRRHPGWGAVGGWPDVPAVNSPEDAEVVLKHIGGLHVYLVRSTAGTYFAGVTVGRELPAGWPALMHPLYTGTGTGVISLRDGSSFDLSPLAQRVLEALSRRKNVIVYGPPGTGKTYALNQVLEVLQHTAGTGTSVVGLHPDDAARPFVVVFGESPIPGPVIYDWVTFHQEFGYEDFVVGLRPTGEGVRLAPFAGRFLDLAIQVDKAGRGSGLMFIDEINRGNVARAMGDFMTYLDDSYRAAPDGSTQHSLPVQLPKIQRHVSGEAKTEPIWLASGDPQSLSLPWFFPHNMYIVATMNSVDRAVAPLDSAIGRRFERIDAGPDVDQLVEHLGVKEGAAEEPWNAKYAAVMLLMRLNACIEDHLGPDVLLGQAFFWNVASWLDLQRAWDRDIWPQLRDRFGTRPEQLAEVLRVDDPGAPADYPFSRSRPGSRTVTVQPVMDLPEESAAEVFRFLAELP